jgi:anaerobic ribonucleoside-triphosphate reductase
METIEQLQEKIDNLKIELEKVKGTETEVYDRIVGYYRAITNWNPGKREEQKQKIRYILKGSK